MESFFRKNLNIIVSIFILLNPLLDLATGVCINYFHLQLTIGVYIRVLFFISMCLIALFVFKKKQLIVPYLIIGLYMIANLVGVWIFKNGVGYLTEIQNLVKVFYFPTLLITFFTLREDFRISKLTLFTVLFLYLFLIFIPYIFHLGYKTYEVTKAGTLGFFHSANEISGIISILTPILFYVLYTSRRWFPRIIYIGMYLVVILMMGTKTPLLTLCITLGLSLAYFWLWCIKKKKYKQIGFSLGAVIVGVACLCLILPRTNFYKNIEVHLKFLKLNSIHEVFEHKETIDHFIFSQRLTFFSEKAMLYKDAPLYEKIFGLGYLREGKEVKQIEMDYFDIYYNYGIAGFLVFFGMTLYVLYKVLEKKQSKYYERYMTETSVLLIFFLAFFTGHIITTPSVGIISIILILSLYTYQTKQIAVIRENDDKVILKELEDSHCHINNFSVNNKKLNYLWFKIMYYQTFDLAIIEEKTEEYGKAASKKQLIYVERKKKDEKNKKIVNKKDLLENIDYYLKKDR